MSWANPQALWLLFAVPIVGLLAWRIGRAPAALEYSDLSWLPAHRSWRVTWSLGLPRLVPLLGAVCFILALARPQWPDRASRITVPARAIVIVLDVSGSMAEEDFGTPPGLKRRLDAAKESVKDLILARPQDQLGLVTFAANTEAVCPPTLSHAPLLAMLAEAAPVGTLPDNTTNIGDALAVAVDRARAAGAREKALVLISDGEQNLAKDLVGPVLRPRQAAQLARGLGIRVHTVFIEGKAASELELKRLQSGAEVLADVAALTGGHAYRASDRAGLEKLQEDLHQLEPTEVPSFRYERFAELYPALLLAGLVVFVVGWVLEETVLRVLPARVH